MKIYHNKFIIAVLMILNLFYSSSINAMEKSKEQTVIILVGASIGRGWDFPALPNRIGSKGYDLKYIGVMDTFDKGAAIKRIIESEKKPNSVIIKECSVYFPGDIDLYKTKIKDWVSLLKNNNVEPILATSVPSGKPTTLIFKIKSAIKYALGKPNRFEQLEDYNNWLRQYSKQEKLRVLDLEAVLRLSEHERFLDPKYDNGDYTHLNKAGYKKLDELAKTILIQR